MEVNNYYFSGLSNVVSLDLNSSWAAKSLQQTLRLQQLDARFQQKQMQEKEEKLLRLYENQQQRAFEKVNRSSAGSNNSLTTTGGGKVRQMFDERRQKAGIDKSYPLEPLRSKTTTNRISNNDRKPTVSRNTMVKSVVQRTVSQVRNGKPVVSKREVNQKVYNNNNGIEHFEEKRYQDNSLLLRENSSNHLEELMNNHNLNDSLDNEVMPQIGYDEVDDTPRQINDGNGRLSVENGFGINNNEPSSYVKATGGALDSRRKEQKTVFKSSSKPSTPVRIEASPSPTPRKTTPTTPSRTMQAKPKANDANNRVPSANRPSAKQAAKAGVVRDDLAECKFCGRRFASDRLDKHEDVCAKSSKKKRKVYDATKHRVQGTELESYVGKVKKGAAAKQPARTAPKKDWRRTHEEFISTIRAAKQALAYVAKGGKLADLPPPPPSSNPDYVQCPHCGRRFNEAAAARHIPKCAEYQFNKPKPGAKSTGKR